MLDHIGIVVEPARFEEVVQWYSKALEPLGYTKQKEFGDHTVGFGTDRFSIQLWIAAKAGAQTAPVHLAFRTTQRQIVDTFHEQAIVAGGNNNGNPGWRHQYHPKYYAAFVLDPVGNNIEVVDHGIES